MTTSRRILYARLWRGVPRELGFLIPILPIVLIGVIGTAVVFFTGLGMLFVLVGVLVVLVALFMARGFGMLELVRLRGAGFAPITPPAWDRVAPNAGWFGKLLAPVADGHYWLYLLHTLVVNPAVGIVTWSVSVTWLGAALIGLSAWAWGAPMQVGDISVHVVFLFFIGLVLLATLPFVTHGLTFIHNAIARGMLAAFLSEELKREVTGLAASRSAAVAAEGTALRRLERDIHDGPQQRLVRLQMDLAAADRQLEGDPEAARMLIAEAMQQSRDALEELRALSRGFAPPILMDRGLVAALESLAVRAAVPIRIRSLLPVGAALPVEVERNAYFIAAEALTNAAKHSGATEIDVSLSAGDGVLDVVITDNGRGGAFTIAGHGLAGLHERTRGLGGTLAVTSPVGGPTTVASHLPYSPVE